MGAAIVTFCPTRICLARRIKSMLQDGLAAAEGPKRCHSSIISIDRHHDHHHHHHPPNVCWLPNERIDCHRHWSIPIRVAVAIDSQIVISSTFALQMLKLGNLKGSCACTALMMKTCVSEVHILDFVEKGRDENLRRAPRTVQYE